MANNKVHLTAHRYYPWLVWGLGAAFFFFEYIVRVSPGVMVTDLMRDFHVNATALGELSAFFYYAYISLQIPVGMSIDRLGMRGLLTGMALLTAVGCAIFASASHLPMADLGRFLIGFGSAFAFVSTLKLVSLWFPSHRVGLLSGLTQALGMVGASVGVAPASLLVDSLGWRGSIWVMAIFFILLALLIFMLVRDQPKKAPIPSYHVGEESHLPIWQVLKQVLSNRQTWMNGLCVGLLYGPTGAFAELWGVAFLERTYHLTRPVAAAAVSMIFVGWGLGAPIIGWISDMMRRRRPALIFSTVISMLLMGWVIYAPPMSLPLLFICLFLYGLANTGVGINYAIAAEINPKKMAGTSLGIANMASILVGAIFQPLVGILLDSRADTTIVNGAPFYTEAAFRFALGILPILLGFSIVFALLVRETHCRTVSD